MNKQPSWDETYKNGRDFKYLSTADLDYIINKTGLKSGKALDIGCGTGQLARDLYHRGFEVTGVDLSPAAIDIANFSTVKLGQGIDFIAEDFMSFNTTEQFDLAICKYVLAFISDKPAFAKKVRESMAPKSCFVVISPNLESLPESRKNIALSVKDIKNLLGSEFGEVVYETRDSDDYFFAQLNR